LLRSKLPPAAVSKRLGHAKVSTTLDFYSHAIEEDETDILSAINNTLR
jgi:integrase